MIKLIAKIDKSDVVRFAIPNIQGIANIYLIKSN